MSPTNTPDDGAVETTGVEAPAAPRRRRATRAATAPAETTAPEASATAAEGPAASPDAAVDAAPARPARTRRKKAAAPAEASDAPAAAASETSDAETSDAETPAAPTKPARRSRRATRPTDAPSASEQDASEQGTSGDEAPAAAAEQPPAEEPAAEQRAPRRRRASSRATAPAVAEPPAAPAPAAEEAPEDTDEVEEPEEGTDGDAQQGTSGQLDVLAELAATVGQPAAQPQPSGSPRLATTALLFQAPDPAARPRRRRATSSTGSPEQISEAARAHAQDEPSEPTEPTGATAAAGGEERPEEQTEGASRRGRGRRRRGGRSGASAEGTDATETQESDEEGLASSQASESGDEPVERADATESADASEDESSDETDEQGGPRRRRRRGGRGRRRSEQQEPGDKGDEGADDESGDTADQADTDDAGEDEEQDGGSSRRRRRRRRGSRSGEQGGSEEGRRARASDEVTALRGSTRLEAKRQRRREGRDAGRRRQIITEAEFLARRESVDRAMVVRERGGRTQIAVLEDGVLVEHYVSNQAQTSMVGNVYLGRVQNVLPSMEAAFVDVGKGRNAVLYAGEVNWDAAGLEGQPRRIEQALKSGDSVLVQVTKDPIGHKGARLTSQITLAGRYLVYVPGGGMTGISRKLPDTERNRLKKILREVVPDSAGVIVRTAAEGASEDELRADIARLQGQWEAIEKKSKSASAPALLQGEPDLSIRVVRDIFNDDFSSLVVQGDEAWSTISSYIGELAPDLAGKVSRYTGTGDVFADHRIDEQLAKGMDRKVWLPSGGSLVIDRTEAMTVVDVNTGKFTGSGGTLEETVTRNNLEAAEEIVRQLRLRDIGGMIVIDFIDMVLESNRDLVLRRLVECLGRDRTKHQVAEVTSLGLVQMTRKRVGQGLVEAFSETCEHCHGRGFIVHEEPVEKNARPDAGATQQPVEGESKRARRKRGAKEPAPAAHAGVPVLPQEREAVKATLATIAAAAAHAHESHHPDGGELVQGIERTGGPAGVDDSHVTVEGTRTAVVVQDAVTEVVVEGEGQDALPGTSEAPATAHDPEQVVADVAAEAAVADELAHDVEERLELTPVDPDLFASSDEPEETDAHDDADDPEAPDGDDEHTPAEPDQV